jgi:hypothetical protein
MNIIKSFGKAFEMKDSKGWDKIYVLVDVHDTIMAGMKPEPTVENLVWYDKAIKALKLMRAHGDICLIMWTGAYPSRIDTYVDALAQKGFKFDYVNENPEADCSEFYCVDSKIYFNVGIDDRFGFEPEEDWDKIIWYFEIIKSVNI